ncbi:hypothetical protein AAE478_008332 [Parahypoxylon ruwenzoriense]
MKDDGDVKIVNFDTYPSGWLFDTHLALRPEAWFVPGKPTKLVSSSHELTVREAEKELYDNQLTDGSDIRGETRLHTYIDIAAPRDMPDPHTSQVGSCSASELSASSLSKRTTTIRDLTNSSDPPPDSCPGFAEGRPDPFGFASSSSLVTIMRNAVSDTDSKPALELIATRRVTHPEQTTPGDGYNMIYRPASSGGAFMGFEGPENALYTADKQSAESSEPA